MTLEQWLRDIRVAGRGIRRSGAFVLAAATILAIGMSGATVMFALINGILLRPLPILDEERLAVAFPMTWLDGSTSFTSRTAVVMGEFFHVAGATPILGRAFTADDDRAGAARTIVLSHGLAAAVRRGAERIGRSLVTRGHAFTIAGVMPPDFEYPRGAEIWTTRTGLADTEPNPAFRPVCCATSSC